jgi:hypothetical protein
LYLYRSSIQKCKLHSTEIVGYLNRIHNMLSKRDVMCLPIRMMYIKEYHLEGYYLDRNELLLRSQ